MKRNGAGDSGVGAVGRGVFKAALSGTLRKSEGRSDEVGGQGLDLTHKQRAGPRQGHGAAHPSPWEGRQSIWAQMQ